MKGVSFQSECQYRPARSGAEVQVVVLIRAVDEADTSVLLPSPHGLVDVLTNIICNNYDARDKFNMTRR